MSTQTSSTTCVELRLLRYAIAVAEDLHFTRASEKLHLATPSLSKQIRQLEQILGYALFERRTREVRLTPAGAAFVVEARQALAHVERAVARGAAASRGDADALPIGYTPLIDGVRLTQIWDLYAAANSSVPLQFHSTYTLPQIDRILNGHLRAGLVVLPLASEELRIESIFRNRLVAAVPENSALAKQTPIHPHQLAGERLIWFGKTTNPYLYNHLREWCQQAAFMPNIAYEVSTVGEILDLVAAGFGVSFVKASLQNCRKRLVNRRGRQQLNGGMAD
ncbi:MAG: LysR family transcriptional regulator, partial [Bryobacterales bacterium]|nr:LysR family transcriptional regulator [Bryobacterales bacterium]